MGILPMSLAILPVVLCYLYYSFRSFNFLFFKKVNPGVPMGGPSGYLSISCCGILIPNYSLLLRWLKQELLYWH